MEIIFPHFSMIWVFIIEAVAFFQCKILPIREIGKFFNYSKSISIKSPEGEIENVTCEMLLRCHAMRDLTIEIKSSWFENFLSRSLSSIYQSFTRSTDNEMTCRISAQITSLENVAVHCRSFSFVDFSNHSRDETSSSLISVGCLEMKLEGNEPKHSQLVPSSSRWKEWRMVDWQLTDLHLPQISLMTCFHYEGWYFYFHPTHTF